MILRKLRSVLKKPKLLLIKPLVFLSPLLGDKMYLELLFPLKVGYKLNLKNPTSYNEKLQWLKLYYREADLSRMADKYEYKEYVKQHAGEEYNVKNYGVWNNEEEIDFDKLPSRFVLKTTHDQGGVVICRDKSTFDIPKAKHKLKKHLKRNLYYLFREWVYKDIKPRIIAEEYLEDTSEEGLKDYKFYCFDGEPKLMYIACGRQGNVSYLDFYDLDFNYIDLKRPKYHQLGPVHRKPLNWELMIELARKMSKGRPHVRIDFYEVDGRLLFGEFTLFQGGGLMPFYPESWDYKLGSYLKLPLEKTHN